MELNSLQVTAHSNACFQSDSVAGTFTDLSVCRNAEDLTCTAGCDSSSSGNVTDEFTGDKVTNDSAVAAGTVVDQSDGFNTFVNRNTESDSTVGNSVQHSVAGTVGNEASSPFLCTAEVTLTDQAGSFFTFGNSNPE